MDVRDSIQPDARRQRVESIFLAAVELTATEREPYLVSACGVDTELRAEVDALLRYDTQAESAIARIVDDIAAEMVLGRVVQRRFGPYRIVSELAQGGMGTVYLAVRDDDEFQHKAAIKLINPGLGTAAVVQRFRQERQILASLDHPYIGRLLDGGTTSEGVPYFIMEYIEGEPIDAWCRARRLSVDERCRLFLRVCEAVAFAHSRLVVHRDLKPRNIFVTADGAPRLLDFGIAKVLGAGEAAPTGADTAATILQAWTPDYASPEQVRGASVTTATDIYSLGAVFYELLTGKRAQRLATYARDEVERVVCSDAPTRPSDVARASDNDTAHAFKQRSCDALARTLVGDLDNIVLMALRKEPERRYSSVEQFADDIRRYLDGRPVRARRDTVRYRATKFVRRHRLGVAAGVVVTVCIAGGTGTTLVQKHRADAQRERAERERQRAEARTKEAQSQRTRAEFEHLQAERERDLARAATLEAQHRAAEAQQARRRADERLVQLAALGNRVLFDIGDDLSELAGATRVRQKMISTTVEYLDALAKSAGDDARAQAVLASGYERLGDVLGRPMRPNLGNGKAAFEYYEKALKIAESILARAPADQHARSMQSGLYGRLGEMYSEQGRIEDAQRAIARAVDLAERLHVDYPNAPEATNELVLLLLTQSREMRRVDLELAHRAVERAAKLCAELVAAQPNDMSYLSNLATAHSLLGDIHFRRGDIAAQIAEYKRALPLRERIAELEPNNSVAQRMLLLSYGKLGDAMASVLSQSAGQVEEGQAYFRRAVTVAEKMTARDAADTLAKSDLANALYRLGCTESAPKLIDDGLANVARAATLFEALSREAPTNAAYRYNLAAAMECAGLLHAARANWDEAVRAYQRSIATVESFALTRTDGAPRVQVLSALSNAARAAAHLNRRDEAFAFVARHNELAQSWVNATTDGAGMRRRHALGLALEGEVHELLAAQNADVREAELRAALASYARAQEAIAKLPPTVLRGWEPQIRAVGESQNRLRQNTR